MIIHSAFYAMLENTSDMIFIKNKNLEYIEASLSFAKMVGKDSVQEILNKRDEEIFEDKELAKRYAADDRRLLENGTDLLNYIEPITQKDGHARYGSTSKYILRDEQGNAIGLFGITKDITREYIARQNYQQELKYLFELPKDTYAVAYIDIDDQRLISQQSQVVDNVTWDSPATVEELFACASEYIQDKNSDAAAFYRVFDPDKLRGIYKTGKRRLVFQYKRKLSDGSLKWIKNEIQFLVDADNGHLCMMLSMKDINVQKEEAFELEKAAKMDRMTMLFNRETAMFTIEQFLKDYSENVHALFMIDIDNFKSVNDTFGHVEGDHFLKAVANEIRSCFREGDIKGRIGGDEFFVLMRNVPNKEIVERKADLLLENIQSIAEKYSNIAVSLSVGISCYPNDGKSLNELYEKADDALYYAKRHGKNRFVLYEDI